MTALQKTDATCVALPTLVFLAQGVVSLISTVQADAAGGSPVRTTVSVEDDVASREALKIAILAKYAEVGSAYRTTLAQTTASALQVRPAWTDTVSTLATSKQYILTSTSLHSDKTHVQRCRQTLTALQSVDKMLWLKGTPMSVVRMNTTWHWVSDVLEEL